MDQSVLTTVFHQCTAEKHTKTCIPGETIRVRDGMPKGSGDVVYELHLLPSEMKPVEDDEHQFDVVWAEAVRRPYQVYTR